MQIENFRIPTVFDKKRCYVHARGLIRPNGFGIMTLQKLELSGSDVFYGLEMMKTYDGGKTFSEPEPCKNLIRKYFADGTSIAMCDATPFYHKKTGKIILTGHMCWYGQDNAILAEPRGRSPAYAVYNEETGDFEPYKFIEIPEYKKSDYFVSGAGCAQIEELDSGELLIPVYFNNYKNACDPWNSCQTVTVFKCVFDGDEIRLTDIGNTMSVDVPRGLGEPSIIRYGEEFYLALRNDQTGYVSKGKDGIHFNTPVELCFEDGENLGNYNTQQHWIRAEKLYLVYTRKTEYNGHIFRNRAPLFIAEFDTEKMCVKRDTEKIAVPERGARLGNFGCQSYSEEVGFVYAAEWMQGPEGTEGCMKYGSDNSIFVSRITFD